MQAEDPAAHPIDRQVAEQAADWLLRMGDAAVSDDDKRACARWQAADPEHARAWQRAQTLFGMLQQLPPACARAALDRPARPGRRAALRGIAGALVLAPTAWLGLRLREQSRWDLIVHTAPGERQQLRLADGSDLDIDTATQVSVLLQADQRRVRLQEGQVMVSTAADPVRPARPFRVETPQGLMQALGTRFNVRVEGGITHLAVIEGAVLARPAEEGGTGHRVEAGQQLAFSAAAVLARAQPVQPAVLAWQHGMLGADGMPLRQVLAELGRYRRGVLTCSDEVASLRISGAFPLHDIDRSLDMLVANRGLVVRRRWDGWWTTIVAGP